MNYRMPAVCFVVLCAQATSNAQQHPTTLKSFFEKRLSDKANTPPPPYEALLTVIDGIGKSDRSDIQSTLPLLSFALKSKTPNLPVEAAFAFFEIARRPDGGAILRDSLPEFAALMASPDERLSGGAVTILRHLTRSIPDATVPVMMKELRSSGRPNLVKAEIVRTLLESSKRNDAEVLKSVEIYLALDADPKIKASNLDAIAANRVRTPAITGYAMGALNDKQKQVQIAAIYALRADARGGDARGADERTEVRSRLMKLASDPSVDREVRTACERALQGKLRDAYKVPEPPPPPNRKGAR